MKKIYLLIYTFVFILACCSFNYDEEYNIEAKNVIESKLANTNTDEYITRGYAAELLTDTNLFGHNRFCINPFADLTPASQYYVDIMVLYRLGIYNGAISSDNQLTYAYSEQYLSREQAACLIATAFDLNSYSSYTDISEPVDFYKTSAYAKQDVLNCLKNRLISADENNYFYPEIPITTQEYLKMLSAVLSLNTYDYITRQPVKTTFNQNNLSQNIYITLNKSEIIVDDKLLLTLYNTSNETYGCGEDFQIEIYKDGQWFLVPMTKGGIDDVGLIIRGNSSNEQILYLKNYFDNLECGHYRIIKIVSQQFDSDKYCAYEFDIK